MRPGRPPSALTPLLLALAGCAGSEPAQAPTPSVAVAPRPAPVPAEPVRADAAPPAVAGDPLCDALGRIVDAEPEGFLTLRVSPADDRRWNGRLVPAGFSDCWIEDGLTAGARYACSGATFGADTPDAVVPSYLALVGAVDACLGQPTWYPMAWRREPERAAARGGHQASWRAGSVGPSIGLALDQHPERQLWFVRLTVGPAAPQAAAPRPG
jgi:hypothetical protein